MSGLEIAVCWDVVLVVAEEDVVGDLAIGELEGVEVCFRVDCVISDYE